MLVSFSVSNFRSFGEEQTLNMVASNKLTDHPGHLVPFGNAGRSLVRTATIYGANASGKSNLVRAMAAAQSAIIRPSRWKTSDYNPFAFRESAKAEPTSFTFRFLLQDRIFEYGFDKQGGKVESEWLLVLDRNENEHVIFERSEDGSTQLGTGLEKQFPEDQESLTTLKVLAALPLDPTQLMLNRAYEIPRRVRGTTLASVIDWLTRNLVVVQADGLLSKRKMKLMDQISENDEFRTLAQEFLQKIGTGIDSIGVEFDDLSGVDARTAMNIKRMGVRTVDREYLRDPDSPEKVRVRKIVANHATDDFSAALPFSEESDGTRKLLDLMTVFSTSHGEGRTVVIDELDRSLHPLSCYEFLRLFSETQIGIRKQLIVTTHEAHLLNQELLRRDEYWFVEKGADQQSRLIPLTDYNVRNDLQIEKGYLQGRFGAIPVIGSTEAIEELINRPERKGVHATQEAAAP